MWSLSVNYLPNSTWRSFTAAGCFMWGVSAKVLGQESMCNHIGNKINMVAIVIPIHIQIMVWSVSKHCLTWTDLFA